MTGADIMDIIDRALYADLGCIDQNGKPAVSRFFCVWHRGIEDHLLSTGSQWRHTRCLLENSDACLYFTDDERFASILLTGRAVPTPDPRLRQLLWYEGDEQYFPEGVDDPLYCVLEFRAESLNWYYDQQKGSMTVAEIAAFSAGMDYAHGSAGND